ncbi:phage tail protein [Aeromonas hydrophila]|uniref:phage tail protein n=1 Tax=Aeromonas hydrophila TaxID=644 RepID=UPI001FF6F8A4|nr:phage tail protein [Aeromonas hydrophila]MCK0185449.1 phage tail protein [Aeromonas hydrophila]UOV92684.1 phage tail protein [Aeromonas hydrophila]
MSNFGAILTTAGAAKLANAIALGVPLKLTQMAVGDGNGQPVAPDPAMTAIPGEKRRAAINTLFADPLAASQLVAEQIIPEDVGGWWIRCVGLYDDSNTLIAIANVPDTYKPLLTSGAGRTQIIRMVLIVSDTSAVELKIDPSVVLATRKYVDDVMKAHKESRDHPDASETAKGFTRYATQAEVNDSAAASAAVVTVKTLWGWVKQATETVLGMMKVASQDQVIAGTADDVAVTPKKLRMGFSMRIGQTGYFSLPVWLGSFILQWGNLTVPTGTVGGIKADIIFPISYPNGAFGIATTSGVNIGSLDTNSEYRLCRQDFSVGIPTQTGVSAQAFVENYAFHSRSFYWISLGR